MKIVVAAVGKLREAGLGAMVDDYVGRIRRYVPCEVRELRSDAALEKAVALEGTIVACEVKGDALTSEVFARRLEGWGSRGKGDVVFLIGGAEGIPRPISARADARLSLSSMTLPHRLARLILVEQIYRGFTILRGEPYARE